jgi:superfamily II DNA/RNA helicase
MPESQPVEPKKFLTNEGENTLSRRLERILPLTDDFDCLVGYFFISGFFRLYRSLESVKKVRILIGLRNEEVVSGLIEIAKNDGVAPAPSTAEVRRVFAGMLRSELVNAQDSLDIEIGVFKFIEWIRSGKLEVKLYREQNIHAKVYIMTPENPVQDVNHGYVITGSSNLSWSGLEGNLEFNVLLSEPEDHDYALYRFNELWKLGVDVKDVHDTIIQTVEEDSPFASVSPYHLYLKFLAEYFRDYLGDRSRLAAANLPPGFKRLQYQEDAVFTAQQMLKAYGGVFLADVVGLGKTYMSALLALQLDGRCLVVAPPNLLDEDSPGSWPSVFRDFGVPGYKCISIGKLDQALEHGVDSYKYVFIDESHRFKGDSNQRYEVLTRICQGKSVVLVSATPYNNTVDDVYSQLKLFQPARNSTIPGVRNLEAFFDGLRRRLKGLHRIDDAAEYMAAIEQNAKDLRERVLKYTMVRRTRSEIEEYYGSDLREQGVVFPRVADPVALLYQLSPEESRVFTSTLRRVTSGDFHYARYQSLSPLYYTGPIEDRVIQGQRNLASFMKIMLVKRLESSFYAFRETLQGFIAGYESVLQTLDDGFVYTSAKHSRKVLELLEDGDQDAIEVLKEQGKVEQYPASFFTPLFRQHVASDLATLHAIQDEWRILTRDPKWDEFKRELETRREFQTGKLVIFSEFSDTARYLAERISAEIDERTLYFCSTSSAEKRRAVTANFDANSRAERDEYRILVTTDVLAEGVNLHRSSVVINYDIPWNPSRLMQRVGRVNRVGTKFETISTFNFFPTDEGNDEIALTEAAKAKIRAFITLLGNDARLLTGEEDITSHNLFDRINSSEAATGGEAETRSELRYLRQILDVKEKEPLLFDSVLALPPRARSTRTGAPSTTGGRGLITYMRRHRLDKFFKAEENSDCAVEIDFYDAAETLETTASEARGDVPLEQFYRLLHINKAAFEEATVPNTETLFPVTAAGSGNEAIVLKRLRARNFRGTDALSPEDRELVAQTIRIIADGRVGKATVRRVKAGFDRTADPIAMVRILRSEVAQQYYQEGSRISEQDETERPSEVVLSSYLV